MLLQLKASDPRPLHDQVAGGLRRAIAEGRVRPGDRLPPAKDLAEQLDVNPNTVLRALRELRDEALLEFRRGRGITIAEAAEGRAIVTQAAADLEALAGKYGYSRAELISMIERLP